MALTLEYLFLWFLLYAFIGWVYESVLVSVSERRWVNRGFLNGPLCPIYGCGAVLAIVLLHDFTNPIEIFLISSFGASILEYITSWGMEKLFHARWWDYSHYRFNIQGRICLLGAIVFGFGGVLIIDVVQPQVERLTAMIPLLAVHVICAVAAIVVIIDTIVICSCTAMLMLLAPQNLTNGLTGMNLLQTAMNYHLGGFGVVFIAVILWMFSFSTFLGILFYARSNVAYLFGDKWGWQTAYKVLALVMLFIGGIQTYTFVWDLGDVGIGLMTIFNIFILYAMSGQAIKELRNYEETKKKSIEERAYALQEDE